MAVAVHDGPHFETARALVEPGIDVVRVLQFAAQDDVIAAPPPRLVATVEAVRDVFV
jgi:hypothetical protein